MIESSPSPTLSIPSPRLPFGFPNPTANKKAADAPALDIVLAKDTMPPTPLLFAALCAVAAASSPGLRSTSVSPLSTLTANPFPASA